jgi:hypothetical protein
MTSLNVVYVRIGKVSAIMSDWDACVRSLLWVAALMVSALRVAH